MFHLVAVSIHTSNTKFWPDAIHAGFQPKVCVKQTHNEKALHSFVLFVILFLGNNIPPQAIPAGQTSGGETLFVGRVNHDGAVTIGKVQPSHGVCYCPYGKKTTITNAEISFNTDHFYIILGGQEVAFASYEILTT